MHKLNSPWTTNLQRKIQEPSGKAAGLSSVGGMFILKMLIELEFLYVCL